MRVVGANDRMSVIQLVQARDFLHFVRRWYQPGDATLGRGKNWFASVALEKVLGVSIEETILTAKKMPQSLFATQG